MNLPVPSDTRLTPNEVQSTEFGRAPLGRRGLDEEQVRTFLMRVEQELQKVFSERAALADEVARLRERLQGTAVAEAGKPQDAHLQAVRILSQAQQTADRYVADAERYTRDLAGEARRQRDEILADARSKAVQVLEDAHRQAALAAATVEPPTGGHGAGAADRELEYLRTSSRVYRTHLRAYLEALLRNVDDWEKSETDTLDSSA
jgi:DivIVA domain-containing protein